jgi:membrane associated rhomboid family serine protease
MRSGGFGPPGGGSVQIGPPGPIPPIVKGLIIANVGVYLLQILAPTNVLIGVFSLIPPRVFGNFEIWRLVSYQFLHAGIWHLAINMLMLWMFGAELEQRWGSKFFLKYYFVCGVGGGLVYTLFQLGSPFPCVGASGAIFGILMAYGLWFPNRVVLVAFLFPIRVRHMILILIGVELLQAIESTGVGIAYAAHLGGMAFGYAYLRWWGSAGLGLAPLPGWSDIKRSYYRSRLRRLQKKRFGNDDDDRPTYH